MSPTFIPSTQQLAIGDAVARADHNIIVDAKAGTGKTTTLQYVITRIPRDVSEFALPPAITFVAFNKNIVEAARPRFPSWCEVTTGHSLGFRALKDSGIIPRNVRVDGGKCRKLVWDNTRRNDPDANGIIKLVSLLKSVVTMAPDENVALELVRRYDIDFEEETDSIETALYVLSQSNGMLDVIDFDDMLYLSVIKGARFRQVDWLLVDEAQDTNDIQLEIFERLQKPFIPPRCCSDTLMENVTTQDGTGTWGMAEFRCPKCNEYIQIDFEQCKSSTRIIAVGDPHQAIYGFRGANFDSMERIAQRFSCVTYPLSVSYRCPKAVVMEAQRYLR